MRRFITSIRSPLLWAVVAEFVVVAALLMLAWHVAGSVTKTGIAAPAIGEPASAPTDDGASSPDVSTLTGDGARGPLPGLNMSSAFWRARLAELNRDQVALAQLEWRIVHAGMAAAKDYVDSVVLPAVRRAEGAALR